MKYETSLHCDLLEVFSKPVMDVNSTQSEQLMRWVFGCAMRNQSTNLALQEEQSVLRKLGDRFHKNSMDALNSYFKQALISWRTDYIQQHTEVRNSNEALEIGS